MVSKCRIKLLCAKKERMMCSVPAPLPYVFEGVIDDELGEGQPLATLQLPSWPGGLRGVRVVRRDRRWRFHNCICTSTQKLSNCNRGRRSVGRSHISTTTATCCRRSESGDSTRFIYIYVLLTIPRS